MEKSANKYKQFNQKQSGNDSTHRVFNFDKKLENAMTKYEERTFESSVQKLKTPQSVSSAVFMYSIPHPIAKPYLEDCR